MFLSSIGFKRVVGSDISPIAIENCNSLLLQPMYTPHKSGVVFKVEDFFRNSEENFEIEEFDLIFDYLFFSAIDPDDREKYSINLLFT